MSAKRLTNISPPTQKAEDDVRPSLKPNGHRDLQLAIPSILPYAIALLAERSEVSTSFLQRKLQIGFERAVMLRDQMSLMGLISHIENTNKFIVNPTPSEVLMIALHTLTFSLETNDSTSNFRYKNVMPRMSDIAELPYGFALKSVKDCIDKISSDPAVPSAQQETLRSAITECFERAKQGTLKQHSLFQLSFAKPATLQTRHRTSSKELDEQVADVERVRAARRLIQTYYRRSKIVKLSEVEMEEVRVARRLVRARDRRQKPISLP